MSDPLRCCLIKQTEDNRKSPVVLLGLETKSWEAETSGTGSASNLRPHVCLWAAENELVSCSLEGTKTRGPGSHASLALSWRDVLLDAVSTVLSSLSAHACSSRFL